MNYAKFQKFAKKQKKKCLRVLLNELPFGDTFIDLNCFVGKGFYDLHTLILSYMALSPYVWTDRLIVHDSWVNAQGRKQVIYINLLQYLLTPLLALSLT